VVAARHILIGVALVGWAGCGKLVGIHGGVLADGAAGAGGTSSGGSSGQGGSGTGGGSPGGGGGSGGNTGGSGGIDAAADPGADRVSADVVTDVANPMDLPPEVPACFNEPIREGKAFGFLGGPNVSGGMGLCSYPNSRLPTNRYYGALDTRLLGVMPPVACGACLQVKSGDKQVEVVIIDGIGPIAPTPRYTISIEPNAVAKLGAAPNSNPDVQFQIIPCSFPEKIATIFDTATVVSTKVLVLNHRTRLTGVQIFAGGMWRDLSRERDNRWAAPFLVSATSNRMRFIDSSDKALEVLSVPFTDYSDTGMQIPPCP
jgi:hypothetical protein